MGLTRTALAIIAAAMCALLVAAGCSSSSGAQPGPTHPSDETPLATSPSDPTTAPSGPTSSSSVPSNAASSRTSSPADPRVAAALKAYTNFVAAANFTYAHPPRKVGSPLPKRGDFRPYSFDPAQGKVLNYVFSLTTDGIEYRGTPPTPRATVAAAHLGAAPYPTVTVTDCPTAPPSWTTYYRTSGKPTASKAGQVKPPYLVTAQLIFYKKHWGVQKLTPNAKRTCTPP